MKPRYTLRQFKRKGQTMYALVGPGLKFKNTWVGKNPVGMMIYTAPIVEGIYEAGYRAGRKAAR